MRRTERSVALFSPPRGGLRPLAEAVRSLGTHIMKWL